MSKVVVKGPEDLGWLKGISLPEKECSICISYLDKKAYIWVNDQHTLGRIKKAWLRNPSAYECTNVSYDTEGNVVGYQFVTDWKNISFRGGNKKRKAVDSNGDDEEGEDEDEEETA